MSKEAEIGSLRELAELWGVEPGYRDARGRWREASSEALLAVVEALGGLDAMPGTRGLRRLITQKRAEVTQRLLEPVVIAWDGKLPEIALGRSGLRATGAPASIEVELVLEDGDTFEWRAPADDLFCGVRDSALQRRLGDLCGSEGRSGRGPRIPFGYHRLRVTVARGRGGPQAAEAMVIAAPRRAFQGDEPAARSSRGKACAESPAASPLAVTPWGLFSPTYALRSPDDWGAGGLKELGELALWVERHGGAAVATLPLLAAYLGRPPGPSLFEPSPYRPASRLFWNEFYLDIDALPEVERSPEGRLLGAAEVRRQMAELRQAESVDYARIMTLKRRVLERLVSDFFADPDPARMAAFERFCSERPETEGYARFRAVTETQGKGWPEWPARLRGRSTGRCASDEGDGVLRHLKPPDYREEDRRYHLYCQWVMDEQLAKLAGRLMLDLPIGVHPAAFDAWRHRDLFVPRMSVGAPPDDFFAGGQVWCVPPLHPTQSTECGHSYFAGCLRHSMRHAAWLRVDHVMGLSRLFYVPDGMEAARGVYVRYPAEELYAVLCLESQRNRAIVVGEDLGTVPTGVRASMRRHGVRRTWVLQAALRPRAAKPLAPVPRGAVAMLGTHDMVPWAGFLQGVDIELRRSTGHLDDAAAVRALTTRVRLLNRLDRYLDATPTRDGASPWDALPPAFSSPEGAREDTRPALERVAAHLLRAEAGLVLLSLDDLGGETKPQNLPGSGGEWPNWRRRTATLLPHPGSEGSTPSP